MKSIEHNFNVEVARRYGVPEAIFIHNLYFWIDKNQCNGRHFYEGRSWTYNSLSALERLFPYFTRKQIRTIIDHCVGAGVVIKGNFNKEGYDKTTWFALTDEVLEIYEGGDRKGTGYAPEGTSYAQEGTGYAHKGTPIPDNKPYSKPDNKEDILVEADASAQQAAITLTLNDKSEHPIYQQQIEEWTALYPAVDVMQELRKMRGWLQGNPQKRKTARGILRFITSWLAREQDKGRCTPSKRTERWLE